MLKVIWLLILSTLLMTYGSSAFGNWYDGTDEEFESYLDYYKTLKHPTIHKLRFMRHERPGVNPDRFECKLITTSTMLGFVPIYDEVAIWINTGFWKSIRNKQEFINGLLDHCLNNQDWMKQK